MRVEYFRPACAVASVAVALATLLFRLAAFNGFENDHFMHVAWGQQLLFGDWPGRDFVEPGMPLVVALSALAQAGLAGIFLGGGARHRDGERWPPASPARRPPA